VKSLGNKRGRLGELDRGTKYGTDGKNKFVTHHRKSESNISKKEFLPDNRVLTKDACSPNTKSRLGTKGNGSTKVMEKQEAQRFIRADEKKSQTLVDKQATTPKRKKGRGNRTFGKG